MIVLFALVAFDFVGVKSAAWIGCQIDLDLGQKTRTIPLGRKRNAVEVGVNLAPRQFIGERQGLGADRGNADDEYPGLVLDTRRRFGQRRGAFSTNASSRRVARDHELAPPRQRPSAQVPGFATHDHRAAEHEFFEPRQVARQ